MAGHYGTVASTLRRGLHEPSTYELQLFGCLNSNYPSLKQQLFVHSTYFPFGIACSGNNSYI